MGEEKNSLALRNFHNKKTFGNGLYIRTISGMIQILYPAGYVYKAANYHIRRQ